MTALHKVGEITHYYTDLEVGTILLSADLSIGDTVTIRGHTTDFTQEVESMELDHQAVERAEAGQEIGLEVEQQVRAGDEVFVE
jgi:putative protease